MSTTEQQMVDVLEVIRPGEALTTNNPSLRQKDDWIRVWRSVALPIPL